MDELYAASLSSGMMLIVVDMLSGGIGRGRFNRSLFCDFDDFRYHIHQIFKKISSQVSKNCSIFFSIVIRFRNSDTSTVEKFLICERKKKLAKRSTTNIKGFINKHTRKNS